MKKIYLPVFFLSTFIFGFTAPSSTPPFQDNPSSFTSYLNQVKWKDQSKRTFFKLSKCKHIDPHLLHIPAHSVNIERSLLIKNTFACEIGFIKIDEPRKQKVCSLNYVSYNATWFNGEFGGGWSYNGDNKIHYSTKLCK